jgi:protein-disulfide isomerase
MSRSTANLILIVAVLVDIGFTQQQRTSENSVAAARPSTVAQTPAGLPSEQTVNGFLQQTFGYDPNVSWKLVAIKPGPAEGLSEVDVVLANQGGQQNTTFYVTADGKHALVGDLIPFGAKPFAEAQQILEKGINGPSRGPAGAPVTIVEFSDLQCPHCKQAQPTIEKLLGDEQNARFVFQQFPLPSHNWAAKAAAYADCIGRTNNAAFWKFINATYEGQSEITEANADVKLGSIADSTGVKGSDVAACAAKPETKSRVDASVNLGKRVDVTGTPALFINGRRIANVNGIPYDVLKSIVEFEAKQGK